MRPFLYDTAIFVYALGGEHRYRDPCKAIVERAARFELRGHASVDLLQEFANLRLRQTGDRSHAVAAAREVADLCTLLDLRRAHVLRGLGLMAQYPRLSARDATFAAVALERGIDAILATDRAFDDVAGLERIDPADEAAVDSLAA